MDLLKVPPQRTGAIGWVINPCMLPADRNTWLLTELARTSTAVQYMDLQIRM